MGRRKLAAAVLALAACSTKVDPTNPFDPATPIDQQAKVTVRGTLAAPTLPSPENLPVSLSQNGVEVAQQRTGATGGFVFAGLRPGTYAVGCAVTGFAPVLVSIGLAPGHELDLGTITLAPLGGASAATFEGRVTLAGRPLGEYGGTTVEAVGRGFTATTDADGWFRLQVIPGTYQLQYRRTGYTAQSTVPLTVTAGEERTLDEVALAANPGSIAGHVEGELPAGGYGPLAYALVTLVGTSLTGQTDAGGDFTLTGVPPGAYLVRVTKDGWVAASAPAFGVEGGKVLTLADALSLPLARGRVVGKVSLTGSADASGAVVELNGSGQAVVTGQDGAFAFDALVGTWGLIARRDGYSPRSVGPFPVTEGSTYDAGTIALPRQGGAAGIAEAPFSAARTVHLVLDAPSATGFHASEDPDFADSSRGDLAGAPWRPYTPGTQVSFTLGDADGEHVVYVVFHSDGGTSENASARVVLDRRAPQQPAIVIGSGAPATNAPGGIVSLTLTAIDAPPPEASGAAVSGLARMELSNTADFAVKQTVDYARTWTWTLADPGAQGSKTVYARFVDAAGNPSEVASATVLYDTVAPDSPAIAIVGSDGSTAGHTRSPLVVVTASANDANGGPQNRDLLMRLSNTDGFVGAAWLPFSPETTWLLSPGDGSKTVYAQFQDAAGNLSAPVSAAIVLDSAGPASPTIAITELDSRPTNGFTNAFNVQLTLGATGGAVAALVAENPALTGAIQHDLGVMPVDFVLGGLGQRTVWVRFVDAAGNLSELASSSVTVDRTAPLALAPTISPSPWAGTTAVQVIAPAAGQDELEVSGAGIASTPSWQPATAGVAVAATLTAGDDPKTIIVRYRDLADNVTTVSGVSVTLDGTGPFAVPFSIRGALADGTAVVGLTATRSVTLDLSGQTDGTGSGIADMMLSESAAFTGASWQTFAALAPFTLSAGDATKTVYAKFRDQVGNVSLAVVSGTITLDTAGPTSPSVTLNENDSRPNNSATNSRSFGLTLSAAGAPVKALVSENPTLAGAAVVDLSGGVPLTTPSTGAGSFTLSDADGAHIVWIRFVDAAGNGADPVAVQVTLDRIAPLALSPALTPSGFAGSTSIQLTPPAAGQDQIEISGAGVSGTPAWQAAPAGVAIPVSLTGGEGAKAITVRYRDAADNVTTVSGLSITLDVTPPAATSFTIAGKLADGLSDGVHTATPSVTLDLRNELDARSGTADMMISNDAGFAGASWEPYVASSVVPWMLSPGEGLRTVYARFRDRVGNVSAPVQGQIELRELPPSAGAVVIEGGARTTSQGTVTLSISAVGATEMQIAVDGLPGTWRSYATSATATLLDPDQAAKVVTVAFRNVARVEGGSASASIWYDHHAPPVAAVALVGTLGNGASSGQYTASAAVVVQAPPPSADAAEMALAQTALPCQAAFITPAWQPAAASATFLLSGADGAKRVCAVFRDDAGNWDPASAATATITLDTSIPTNPAFADLASGSTSAPAVTGTLVADSTDPTSPVTYQCLGGTTYGAVWTDCTPSPGRKLTFALAANQANTLAVRARDAAHNYSSAASVRIVHDDVAPLPPYVTLVQTADGTVRVAWDPSASDDVVGYRVNYGMAPGDTGGTGAAQGPSPIDVGGAHAFQLDGLVTGAAYYVSVVAVDAAGNVSLPSTERVAVPSAVNPRLLSTYGSDFAKLTFDADGLNTWAFVGARQGVLMLDARNLSAPKLVARAALPGVMPSNVSDMPVVKCTRGGVQGYCVYVAGSTLEASYRSDPTMYRAAATIVFLQPGTDTAPAIGEVLGSLGIRAERLVVSPDQAYLYAFDRDGVHAFAIAASSGADPTKPRRVGGGAYVTPGGVTARPVRVNGAGLSGSSLIALFTPPGGAPVLGTWSVANPAAGLGGSSVAVNDGAGRSLVQPDPNGKAPDPLAVVWNGAVYVAWNTYAYATDGHSQIKIGKFSLSGGAPSSTVLGYDNIAQTTAVRWCIATVVSTNRIYFFAPDDLGIAMALYPVVDSGGVLSLSPANPNWSGRLYREMVSAAALPAGGTDDNLFLVNGSRASGLYPTLVTSAGFNPNPPSVSAYDERASLSLAKAGEFAYLAAGGTNPTASYVVRAIDVSNPLRPFRVDVGASATGGATPLAAHGRTLVAGNQVFSIAPSGQISAPRSFTGTFVGMVGKHVYTQSGSTITAFDASFATSPVPYVASVTIPSLKNGGSVVGTAGGHLFWVDGSGLTVLRQAGATFTLGTTVTFPQALDSSTVQARYQSGMLTAGDSATSYVIDVSNEAAPQIVPTPTSTFGVGAPMLLQHGYGIGTDSTVYPVKPESGLRFVDGKGDLAGVQPFAGCGVSWNLMFLYIIKPSLVAADGLYYLACPSVGMQLLSAANPNSGALRVDQPFPGAPTTSAAFALDGVTAFLGGASYGSAPWTTTLWRADADATTGSTGADPAFVRTTDPSDGGQPTTLTMIEGVAWATLTTTTTTPSLVSYDAAAPDGPWPRLGRVNVGPANGVVYPQPVTDDETLYLTAVASGAPELSAIDVRTPANPAKLWTVTGQTGQTWDGLALSRQRLYAARNTKAAQPADVSVWDVSGPSPVALTSVTVCDLAPVKKLHEIAVQGEYLFFTYDSSSGVAPYGVGVVKLGTGGSGDGATLVGTWESGLPLGSPQVVGDLLYVRANQGLAVFDLTLLWRYGLMPESLGLRGPPEGSTTRTAVRLVVDGPWAFLLGDSYRIFDLR